MTPNQLSQELDDLILAAISSYEKSIISVQNKLYDSVLLRLKDLELSEGYIKQNAYNRKIIREVQAEFDNVIQNSKYIPATRNYLLVIPKINSLTTEYFQTISESFQPNKQFLKSLQGQTIKNINDLILNDGLQANVKIPLNQILEQNVSSGGSYTGMVKQVQDYIKGGEHEGQLLKYVKTYTTDALFSYSRSYMEAVTADLKLDWYLYSGGIIDTTREFCEHRTGNYYHRREIESWADLEWKGKRPGTTKSSIFIFLAGWNCRHELIPVSTLIVPKDDLERITN
jgi:hypothetical protein